jgi:hypothetical protein
MTQEPRQTGSSASAPVAVASDGNELAWGAFDDDGIFVGQGGSTVPDPGHATHQATGPRPGQKRDDDGRTHS